MQLNEIIEIIYQITYQIKNKLPQKFQTRNTKFWLIALFFSIISITWLTSSPTNNVRSKPKTAPIKKLSETTVNMFDEVKKIAANTANTVNTTIGLDCRKVASMIQRSPAFEYHGCEIATGLRKFKVEILEANLLLQKMYVKGSQLHESFDEKIEEMMKRFKNQKRGETKYFKEGINFMITKAIEFKQSIKEAHDFTQEVEKTRHVTEGYIHDGMREAENFMDIELDYLGHTIDKEMAIKEISIVHNFLDHLNNIAEYLEKMNQALMRYEDNLKEISKDLDDNNKEKDDDDKGTIEVTRDDFKLLKHFADRVKDSHYKFIQKSLITC
ncbi:hypothetical protein RclHR1_00070050 [Rhizophagus clarus]|uniref:Uncharacterized protein n=1 Tax=Rhizophagus clarus TaxID=94130 RepID=A0A2Z6S0X0_9GLOM|nr:hypothetical protein RclHR1_00070050 [Rhizophagus clarus]GES78225.1 hypothetical protein GLOIN_2v1576621 [Rhizophagus clarus]